MSLYQDVYFNGELIAACARDYPEHRTQLVSAARSFLDRGQQEIHHRHLQGLGGQAVVQQITELQDQLLQSLYGVVAAGLTQAHGSCCVLLALGGYGRAELNPRSDIDLMFYYCRKGRDFAEALAERLLYILWDLNLEVGYSVRSSRDSIDMAERDITVRTALLDARYLTGSLTCYTEFEDSVLQKIYGWNSKKFLQEKLDEHKKRLQKYGSSVFLLEPNIKEGEGGLRDLQTAMWMAQVKYKCRNLRELVSKGVVTERQAEEIERALDYLWRIRNELHYLSKGKNEQLRFDQQEKIALFLGYQDTRQAPAVEQFMQDYYAHATHVEHIAAGLMAKALGAFDRTSDGTLLKGRRPLRRPLEGSFYIHGMELRVDRDDLFAEDPTLMMRAFRLAQQQGVQLSIQVKTLIRESLPLINDRVRRSRIMTGDFMDILRAPQRVAESLRMMHHLRFLNHFIPEFGRLYCKVQHDAYHIYTVDFHSLFALEELVKIWRGEYDLSFPLLREVAEDLEKRELLLLAALLHDIGKGQGKDHCNKGADMIPTISRRLGLNKEDADRLEFLVRNHLRMAHISQRRDLHDDVLIVQFAKQMGMSENLRMLFLLTVADIKAVGPDVWSGWKGLLLQELYEKAYDVLERGDFYLESRSERIRNRKRRVVELLKDDYSERAIKDRLNLMSTRYLFAQRSASIASHLRLIMERRDQTLAFAATNEPDADYCEVIIVTLDIPGLFTMITGVMAAFNINILGAQIYTHKDGLAFDILQVRGHQGSPLVTEEKWQQVQKALEAVIEGRMLVEELVKERQRVKTLPLRPRPSKPSRIDIDNEVSKEYTVLDIYTHDKVGLLYTISKTLRDLGLYIGVSKISTKVDQVADTFYVRDIFGQKITDPARLDEIQQQLLQAIDVEVMQ
jgi:[protein-PII] uridylyltransferase